MQDNDQNNSQGAGGLKNPGTGNEGSHRISNEDDRPAGSESPSAGSGETGTVGGPHGGADDIGRSGTGSAMTGQTSILSDDD
jgi:hypothetical protein